ncbi:MAG TPA: CHASE2 domain-containing protein [Albitalea sp.]
MKVFISYRRDDSIVHARLIHNELAARFGADHVFMDIDDIDYGDDFAALIDRQLDAADVVVAVIGPKWHDMLQSRLHGDDYVRHELARALARGLRVVPVLVGKAAPPGTALPGDLAGLRTLNGLNLDERALKPHINALVETLQGRSFEEVARRLDDRLRSQRRARWIGAGVGLVTFLAAWVALFDFAGLDTRLASATMWLAGIGQPAPWSGEVVLVAIDEATERQVGRPFDASWRREHALLIQRLAAAGVRSIAFDLFVERPADPLADDALEAALREAAPTTPVVFAVRAMEGNRPLLWPRFAAFAGSGVACAGQKLGYARSMPLALQRGQLHFASLALAAFSGGGRIEGLDDTRNELRVRVPRDERSPDLGFSTLETVRAPQTDCEALRKGDRVALQLLDPARLPRLRDAPRRIGYEQVLGSAAEPPLSALRGKIVLVGLQLRDKDVVGIRLGDERWGVELIAAQIDALSRGSVVRPAGALASMATMVLMALLGAFARRALASRAWPWHAAALLGMLLACGVLAVWVYRSQQWLINLPYAVTAFGLAWAAMARSDRRGVR